MNDQENTFENCSSQGTTKRQLICFRFIKHTADVSQIRSLDHRLASNVSDQFALPLSPHTNFHKPGGGGGGGLREWGVGVGRVNGVKQENTRESDKTVSQSLLRKVKCCGSQLLPVA